MDRGGIVPVLRTEHITPKYGARVAPAVVLTGAVRGWLPPDQYSVIVYITGLTRSDQYLVTVRGMNRVSRRTRKLVWAGAPVTEEMGSGVLCGQDIGGGYEVDSAWGARGHMTHSADSSEGAGVGPTEDGTRTRDATPPDRQKDDYGAEPVKGPGRKDFGGM